MKAVLCRQFGPPGSLVIEQVLPPVAAAGPAVISIKAVGLNFFDTLIIEGKYQYKPAFPFSPGAEVAGIVTAVHAGVGGLSPGDRVVAFTGWGGAREALAVPVDRIVKLPDAVSFEAAAGLTVTYGTTLHALAERGRLQPGETLAILGAAGGTGQAAIEIGKLMGARVIACASSPDKLARTVTGGKGVDAVYDPVGGTLAEPALRAMAWGGRYLVIGFASGEIPKLPLNLVLLKGCDVVGVFWGSHIEREPASLRAAMQRLLSCCAAGQIAPNIHKAYRLDETAAALTALARREVKGKAILVV